MKRKRIIAGIVSLIVAGTTFPLSQPMDIMNVVAADNYLGLVINEVCASNATCLQDENGDYSDWIELYNASETTIDLSGVGISDGTKKKFKFKFDDNIELAAGEYCIIFCDETNSTLGELHADFKIGADGETLYLTAPDETNIDTIEVPALDTDITYGRYPDGTASFAQIMPTPGASNNDSTVIVEKPEFSVDGGFYNEEFDLTLSDSHSNTILYTLDGSDPRTSDTAVEFKDDIHIYDNTNDPNVVSAVEDITLRSYSAPKYNVDKGIVVRAVCKDNLGAYSGVVTNNYFVNKTASYYTDMRVIAISTDSGNFFDPKIGIYVVGDQYREWKNGEEYDPKLNIDSNKNPTNYNMGGREWERPCNIQIFEYGQLQYTEDVGINIGGNWSTSYPQKSLTLTARSEYGSKKMKYDFFNGNAQNDYNGKTIKEHNKVTLRNGGNDNGICYFRDDLNHELANNLSFGTQAKYPYIVFINGEFWGYYSMQEKLEEHYIESHYDVDSDNVTIVKNGLLDEGSKDVYNEWEQFWSWLETADMTENTNYQQVCDIIDVQCFIDYITFESYIANWDCLLNKNNWEMWRVNSFDVNNSFADGKWRFLLFDTDQSCGSRNESAHTYNVFKNIPNTVGRSNIGYLYLRLMENKQFKKAFYERFYEITEENFNAESVQAKIDSYQTNLLEAILATNQRFNIKNNFNYHVNKVRTFFNNRAEYALQQLDSFCGAHSLTLPDNMEIVIDDEENKIGQKYLTGAEIGIKVKDGYSVSNVKANDIALNADEASVYMVTIGEEDVSVTAFQATLLKGNTVSFKDNLTLNFLADIDDDLLDGAYVNFTYNHYGDEKTVTVPVNTEDKNGDYYRFRCELTASEMTIDVKADLYLKDSVVPVSTWTRSIRDYCIAGLNDENTFDKEKKLLRATLNYGGYTQQRFGYNGAPYANADYVDSVENVMIESDIDFKRPTVAVEGLKYIGASVFFRNAPYVRYYFDLTNNADINDYTFTITQDGKDTELVPKVANGYYYVESVPELAYQLDNAQKVNVSEKGKSVFSFDFSVVKWLELAVEDDNNADKDMAKAMYVYYQAAKEFVENNSNN